MKKNVPNILGLFLIFIGIAAILNRITGFNLWSYLLPLLFIIFGLFMIFKPKFIAGTGESTIQFVGEINRSGQWNIHSQEMWMFVGDIKLDFRNATIPDGITELHIFGFVQDIRIIKPTTAALAYKSNAFVSDNRVGNQKEDRFLNSFEFIDQNYENNPKKININTWGFVHEVRIES